MDSCSHQVVGLIDDEHDGLLQIEPRRERSGLTENSVEEAGRSDYGSEHRREREMENTVPFETRRANDRPVRGKGAEMMKE